MKPLLIHIIFLSISIRISRSESNEAKLEGSSESLDQLNQEVDNFLFDQEAQPTTSLFQQIQTDFDNLNYDYVKTELKNINYKPDDEESPPPNRKVEALFPYELYTKVKVSLPSDDKYVKHVLKPVLFDKPIPVKVLIDRPFPVEKRVPVYYPVKIDKPVPVKKLIRVPVPVEVLVKKRYPVYKDVPVPVPVYVAKPVPKFVEDPYPVPVFRKKEDAAEEAKEMSEIAAADEH